VKLNSKLDYLYVPVFIFIIIEVFNEGKIGVEKVLNQLGGINENYTANYFKLGEIVRRMLV